MDLYLIIYALKEKKTSKVKVSHVEDIEHFHLTRHHDQGYSVPGLDEDIIKCANLRAHIDCPDDPLDNYDFSKHIEKHSERRQRFHKLTHQHERRTDKTCLFNRKCCL